MPWVYEQSTGKLYAPDQTLFDEAHAGNNKNGQHMDNPDSQCVRNKGPIPRGEWRMAALHNKGVRELRTYTDGTKYFKWTISPYPRPFPEGNNSLRKMPSIIRLEPVSVEQCSPGRSGFYIHGGKAEQAHSAGCILVDDTQLREQIWNSADRILYVVRIKEDAPSWVGLDLGDEPTLLYTNGVSQTSADALQMGNAP